MSRLTKKQTQELRAALNHLLRGYQFLYSPQVVVGVSKEPRGPVALPEVFVNAQGDQVQVLCKEIGNDLSGFDFAVRHLRAFAEKYGQGQPQRGAVQVRDTT